ncbi:MAG: serine hydrolase [Melioribacteraceae bacterium]|nr:serine hydrolase [Melioribacteraceae bacterium]
MNKLLNRFFFLSLIILLNFSGRLSDDFSGKADSPFPLSEAGQQWVESKLASMSLKEKCAQMIMSNASSRDTSEDSENYKRLKKLVRDFKVGGLIFFQGKVEQQILLTNELQALSETPLLISADYERGPGMRLEDIIQYPHNMAVGAVNDPQLTYLMGKYIAGLSRAIGVHINFAPLLDVNHDYRNPVINIRSYSEDPNIIAWQGNAFIKGMHDGGMITTAKHFPGHGATDLDSHESLPLISQSIEEFERIDFVPFREAVNAGVKSVMIGHLEVPAMETRKNFPASFSHSVINDYLKSRLHFGGLVITDALNMKAVADSFTCEEAAKLSVIAGNDILLFPPDDSLAIEGIYNSVIAGEISESRINESVRKILSAKRWLNLDQLIETDIEGAKRILNEPSYKRLAKEIAEKSITLIKDDDELIPINPDNYYRATCISLSGSTDRSTISERREFEKLVDEHFGYIKTYRLNIRSRERELKEAFKTAEKSDLILLNLFITSVNNEDNRLIDEAQKQLVHNLIDLNKPILISNFGNPYLLSQFSNAPAYICSYSWTDISQQAMFDAITGRNEIKGRMPVSIPGTSFKIGFGKSRRQKTIFNPGAVSDTNFNFTLIDSIMLRGVEDSVFPGAVLLVGKDKKIVFHKPYGHFTYDTLSNPMTVDAIFDLASLTKVIATTSAAMLLYDRGQMKLNQKVATVLPQFRGSGKKDITIKHLLTHTSGLPAFKNYYKMYNSKESIINDIMSTKLIFNPGEDYTYSDIGMIVLQLVIEKITNQPIDSFLQNNIFNKLDMHRTMYNPPAKYWFFCPPTEVDNYWRYTTVKGKVHDENASMLSGVAGHAGLFATAEDIANLLFTYLNEGYYNDTVIFKKETIGLFTIVQSRFGERGLGWDIKSNDEYSSGGTKLSKGSYGHTGFTGTSVWTDKEKRLFIILLTNRVYPSRNNRKIIGFRPLLHDAVVDAISYK